jgi:transcription initiation factor TFIIF subunit beta
MIERTKLFGKIHYDVRVEPRNIREEERLLARRLLDAESSKTKLQIISRNSASAIINPGTAGSATWGGGFIVCFLPSPRTISMALWMCVSANKL